MCQTTVNPNSDPRAGFESAVRLKGPAPARSGGSPAPKVLRAVVDTRLHIKYRSRMHDIGILWRGRERSLRVELMVSESNGDSGQSAEQPVAQPDADQFQVIVEGPGFKLDRVVDATTATAITHIVFGVASIIPPATQHSQVTIRRQDDLVDLDTEATAERGPRRKDKHTLGEYLAEVQPKTATDKITAVGEYFHLNEDKEEFTQADFKKALHDIRDNVPTNIPRDFGLALKSTYIAKRHGGYYVTKTGRNAIAQGFPRRSKKSAAMSKKSTG